MSALSSVSSHKGIVLMYLIPKINRFYEGVVKSYDPKARKHVVSCIFLVLFYSFFFNKYLLTMFLLLVIY